MRPTLPFRPHARAIRVRPCLYHDVRRHVSQIEGCSRTVETVGEARRGAEGGGYRAIAFTIGEVIAVTVGSG